MARSTDTRSKPLTVHFGQKQIEFTLVYRDRKNLTIEVNPDRTVRVIVPKGRTLEEVFAKVQKRAPWILKQQAYFDRFHPMPMPRKYVSGETHRYLGRQYRLKVLPSQEDVVKLVGRYVRVLSSRPDDPDHTKRLVEEWYRAHAKAIFERRLALCLQAPPLSDIPSPPLSLRRLRTRWGSCSKRGTILLNTELVKAPLDCVDYVITHELCHLKVHEHTPAFYRLLTHCLSDWERRKQRLEFDPQ